MVAKKNYLESLRGIAALSVAIHHLYIGSVFNNAFTENAWIFVDLFFVLSGYVMALSYIDKINNKQDLITFQKRRFWRLYPLHIVMLFVFLGIEISKYGFEIYTGIRASDPAFSTNNFSTFLQNVFMLQNTLGYQFSWNYPSWSISAEFYTYFLFALLLTLFGRKSAPRYLIILGIMIFSASLLMYRGVDAPEGGIFRCLFSFFLGSLLFELEGKLTAKKDGTSSLAALASLIATVGFIIYLAPLRNWTFLGFPLLCALLIMLFNRCDPKAWIIKVLELRWLVYLGAISYGVYMIHVAVWWCLKQTLRFVVGAPTKTSETGIVLLDLDNVWLATSIHLAGILIVIMLAHFSYYRLEKPLSDKFRG